MVLMVVYLDILYKLFSSHHFVLVLRNIDTKIILYGFLRKNVLNIRTMYLNISLWEHDSFQEEIIP